MKTKLEWKWNKNQFVISFLIGVFLLVISMPVNGKKQEKNQMQLVSGEESIEGYTAQVEKKLSHLLSAMEGVGDTTVMVTFQETDYMTKKMYPKAEGVVVIAEGGGNPVVVKQITETVQALFDVESHKIKVMKRNKIK